MVDHVSIVSPGRDFCTVTVSVVSDWNLFVRQWTLERVAGHRYLQFASFEILIRERTLAVCLEGELESRYEEDICEILYFDLEFGMPSKSFGCVHG